MPRNLTAMYSNLPAAEKTREQLINVGLDPSEVSIQDQQTYAGASATPKQGGMLDGLKYAFSGHDDHHAYAEGMGRGHVLLTATVADAETDKAIDILEASDAVDLEQSEAEWRRSGWTGKASASSDGEMIQLAEERLVVGKREVERGGVPVRSYIVSTPVSEQVTLREENVIVDRHAVNRPLAAGEDAFRDRTIEVRETAEEAVVGKQTVVTEEIGIRKEVGQRTEEVRDTVRHTEVDVERVEGAAPAAQRTL